MQVLWCAGIVAQLAYGYCLNDLSAIHNWVWKQLGDILFGVGHILYASLLEGKRVPTFPMKACRRQYKVLPGKKRNSIRVRLKRLSGLQISGTLAKALELIRKYGLESERQVQSPVKVAIESLLSNSTLEVAASPEMDLTSSIDYFLNESQFTLDKSAASKLRFKTRKCLEWARDPDRPAAATTVDEAAAIMLYTQQTCMYPQLNSALRDHINSEKLEPFKPFLRLLLTGLNKLPLIRTRVYRGVTLDLHEQYNKLQGQVLTWWAFSSSTMREDLIHEPTFLGTTGDRTLFGIDAIGVDISAFSAHPDEQEVLLLPGTPLIVKPGVNVEPGYWKFEASVWLAIQHQRRQQEKQIKYRSFENLLDAMLDNCEEPKSKFQKCDLPHPGWGKIVYMEDDIYSEPLVPASLEAGVKIY